MQELDGQLIMPGVAEIIQDSMDKQYETFKEKFKAAKTTDDCYTPQSIYSIIANWVAREYNVDPAGFMRPFKPGGDYQAEAYPEGCTVVDNPPFSILTEIIRFYRRNGVRFFLFAPTLTLFTGRGEDISYLATGCHITYENGAVVNTSFITDLDTCRIRTVPELKRLVDAENNRLQKVNAKELPKYEYPDFVVTAAIIQRLAKYGVEWSVAKDDCIRISALDSQKSAGKTIFGGGFLLSERAAAERAAAVKWEISPREMEIIKNLGGTHGETIVRS